MSEIFNHGERGNSLKNRALNPFAGALAALMMTVGGQKSLAAPTTPLNDPKKPQTEQVEEKKDLKNTVESQEKEKQGITILAGDDELRNFLSKSGYELPYIPHWTTIQGKDILEQVKDKQWPIWHRRVRFFLSNNIDNQPIRVDLKNIKDINWWGKYNDIKIWSIEWDCIQTEPWVLEIKGPSLVGLNYTDENGDYQSMFITFNSCTNPNISNESSQSLGNIEKREISTKEELNIIGETNSLSKEELSKIIGKNFLSEKAKISFDPSEVVAHCAFAPEWVDPNSRDGNTRKPTNKDIEYGEELGIKAFLEKYWLEPNKIEENIIQDKDGGKYKLTKKVYVWKVASNDGTTYISPVFERGLPGKTFFINNYDIETIRTTLTITINGRGSLSFRDKAGNNLSSHELHVGKTYQVIVQPEEWWKFKKLQINEHFYDENNIEFEAKEGMDISLTFEKIETPIEKITPTVEITGTGEGTTTFLDENGTPVTELEVGKKYTINISAAPKSEIKNITLNNTDISITNTSNMEYSFTCEKPCEWIITINKITSNNEVNNTFRIATQPGKLILSTQNPQAVQVYDMNGTLKYYNRNLQGEEHLNLPTGIYLIKTEQGSQKVIIQ